jgi:hypothetical protein
MNTSILTYSFLKQSTGLAIVALIDCQLTVASAIRMAANTASRNTPAPISIDQQNFPAIDSGNNWSGANPGFQ